MKKVLAIAVVVLLGVDHAPAQTGLIDVGDAKIHYDVQGQGEALVLIHGWTNDLTYWNAQMSDLVSRFKVIRYDRRGWGASTGFADGTADPADLAALLDTLRIPSAHVLGHSQGAGVALTFAVAFPNRVKRLVLYGSPPPAGFGLPWNGADSLPNFRGIARQQGMDSVRAVLLRHPLVWSPTPKSAEWQKYFQGYKYEGRDLLEDHTPTGKFPRASVNQLRQLSMPTLILIGDHEIPYFQVTSEALTYGINGAQKIVIPNAGHMAHLAQPTLFNRAVLKFLTGAIDNSHK